MDSNLTGKGNLTGSDAPVDATASLSLVRPTVSFSPTSVNITPNWMLLNGHNLFFRHENKSSSSGSYGRRNEARDKQVEEAQFSVGMETWTTLLVQSQELTQPSDSMLC